MKKGFTLIELLVVISIIGLLASVALASLSSARAKAADASIKQNLSGIRPQAELYYDNNGESFGPDFGVDACASASGNLFVDPNIASAIEQSLLLSGTEFGQVGGAMCSLQSNEWVVLVPFKVPSENAWCVDSSGNSKAIPLATVADGYNANQYFSNCDLD